MSGKSAALAINIVADASRAVAAFDSTGDAGKKMAELIGKNADKLERELEQTRLIAERLGQALGPELAAKMGQGKVDDYARQMAKAGLSVEQVDDAAEDLARQLERLHVAADQGAANMTRGMDDVADRTDRAADATRSFAGNAVGDFASTAAGIGPLGEAVGQLTEGILAGEVAFGSLALAGAGIAGVGMIFKLIGDQAEETRKKTEAVEGAVEAIAQLEYRQAAKELVGAYKDLFQLGENYGVSVDLMAAAIRGSDYAMAELTSEMWRQQQQTERGSEAWIGWDAVMYQVTSQIEEANAVFEGTVGNMEEENRLIGLLMPGLQGFTINTGEAEDATGLFNDELDTQLTRLDLLAGAWDTYWQAVDNLTLAEETFASMRDNNMEFDERVRLVGDFMENVLKVPPDAMDRFIFHIEQGDLDRAYEYLEVLSNIRMQISGGTTRMGEAARQGIGMGAEGTSGLLPGQITINMPAGADGAQVVAALQQWQRDNGAIPVTTTSTVVP